MAYRNLKNEINISDMRAMKANGMTNVQIGMALGISHQTVCKYIGQHRAKPQHAIVVNTPAESPKPTFGDRVQAYLDGRDAEVNTPKPDTTKVLADFEILSCITTLKGKVSSYIVDTVKGTVELNDGMVMGILDGESIDTLIEELKATRRRLAG